MQHVAAAERTGVGNHEASETDLFFQNLTQQPVVGRTHRSVERVVGGHDRAAPSALEACFERGQGVFLDVAFVRRDRVAVASPVAHVGDEVLGGGDDASFLKFRYESDGHLRREERVFAIGLFRAAPADVGCQVDYRRENIPNAARFGLHGNGGRGFAHQSGIERGGHADRLWKDDGSAAA